MTIRSPMREALDVRLRVLLEQSRGLDEPYYDINVRITNWPPSFVQEVNAVAGELVGGCSRGEELRACADLLNPRNWPDVPQSLLRLLARALFDNPDTPIR
jgi:hypothetical protein